MKKNVVVLLTIPFLINLLGLVTITATYTIIDNEMIGIEWDYSKMETLRLNGAPMELKARPVAKKNFPLSPTDTISWRVIGGEENVRMENENGKTMLYGIKEGTAEIMCSNKNQTIYKVLDILVYENGSIVISPKVPSSHANVDSTLYFGEFDLYEDSGALKKKKASFDVDIFTAGIAFDQFRVVDQSPNFTFDLNTGHIEIKDPGESYLTIGLDGTDDLPPVTFNFDVVDDGVNVYDYDQLLYCTNKSESGEIVVLRKSFESLDASYNLSESGAPISKKSEDIECFGKPDASGKFDFKNDLYKFESTFNTKYIEAWNEFAKGNSNYNPITADRYACVRLQKSIYGNGFSLNFNNATFPTSYTIIGEGESANRVPILAKEDLFRGPLPLYLLGNPNDLFLIGMYGQDNCGLYIDGDNVIVNDVHVRNCNLGGIFDTLKYVGNVIDVKGQNAVVKNSMLRNGRNIVRTTSNLTLDNCLVENGRDFLMEITSDVYSDIDDKTPRELMTIGGEIVNMPIEEFMAPGAPGDTLMLNFLMAGSDTAETNPTLMEAMRYLQRALNHNEQTFTHEVNVKDSLFANAGIAGIVMETYFNGGFLYNAAPSMISEMLVSTGLETFVPMIPKYTSGNQSKVRLRISKDTRFYDYKTQDEMDLSNLIMENLTTIANSILGYDKEITIDQFFPLKQFVYDDAREKGYTVGSDLCIPICYYGGGFNGDEVIFEDGLDKHYSPDQEIDLVSRYLNESSGEEGTTAMVKQLMKKMVVAVSGVEPFKFSYATDGYMHGQSPDISILKNHVKK